MKKRMQILVNGIFKENPVLVLVLGCCSVLAISVTVKGSLGMGAALTFVLVGSNVGCCSSIATFSPLRNVTVPLSYCSSPATHRRNVVLPAPFFAIMPILSPS